MVIRSSRNSDPKNRSIISSVERQCDRDNNWHWYRLLRRSFQLPKRLRSIYAAAWNLFTTAQHLPSFSSSPKSHCQVKSYDGSQLALTGQRNRPPNPLPNLAQPPQRNKGLEHSISSNRWYSNRLEQDLSLQSPLSAIHPSAMPNCPCYWSSTIRVSMFEGDMALVLASFYCLLPKNAITGWHNR